MNSASRSPLPLKSARTRLNAAGTPSRSESAVTPSAISTLSSVAPLHFGFSK